MIGLPLPETPTVVVRPLKSIRVLLVDDQRTSRLRLRHLLEQQQGVEVIGECEDGETALAMVDQREVDVLFLDIGMPGMDGFAVMERLGPGCEPLVVFITGNEKDAVRAFDSCAIDYLVRPVAPDRLARALRRVRHQLAIRARAKANATAAGAMELEPALESPRFAVRGAGRVSFVAAEEIDWIEAAGNYAIFHVGKRSHMIRETMSSLETQLPGDHFMRVSRSAILNLTRVKELENAAGGLAVAVLSDGQRVPATRGLREIADRLTKRN
jgi:two-component system LytT family response regulator